MSLTYSLLIQSIEGVLWNPGLFHHKEPNLCVVIFKEGVEVHRTPAKRGLAPQWETLSRIGLNSDSSAISLRLFHDSSLPGADSCLGVIDISIGALLEMCIPGDNGKFAKLQLRGVHGTSKGKPAGTLSVRLTQHIDTAASALEQAQRDVKKLKLGPATSVIMQTAGIITNTPSTVEKLQSGLSKISAKIEVLVSLGDQIATIHPYANAAWKILTSVYQAARQQQEADEKLLKLVDTMVEVYSFVEDTEFLAQKIKSLENQTLAIAKQTHECAYFIQEYTAQGFCSRAVRNNWTHADQKIDGLSATLLHLKDCFEDRLTVQSLFLSTKMLEKLDSLEQSDALKKLNAERMDVGSRPDCLPGTRVEILDYITEWLSIPSDSGNVLWLCGVAGSGKSTISTTISNSFRGLERLGAFLFFDRNDRAHSHPDSVIRTLAYQLAQSNPHIASAISAAIQRDPAIASAPIRTQFKELLLDPLESVQSSIQGPIVIILDALDECGDPTSRAALLSVLSVELPKLPQLFRVLITGRDEKDIADQFQPRFANKQLDVSLGTHSDDIDLFIRHEMDEIRKKDSDLGPTWPGEPHIRQLVDLSGGLFIWAATATKFIGDYDPTSQLTILLTQNSAGPFNLDHLYALALRNSGPWGTNPKFAEDARAVVACVVLGRVPMTDRTMDMLVGHRPGKVLDRLRCVVQWSPGAEARTLHASFADYLTDPGRSGSEPWTINLGEQHRSLAQGCFKILNSELRFNICDLEDSHLLNGEVPDISDRITAHISPQLYYSSCFWSNHIKEALFDEIILEEMRSFFFNQFLYWLEVLSLLGKMSIASEALWAAADYAKQSHDEVLSDFIADTVKFVVAFAPVIAQSAPHIYLSALAFTPQESRVVKQFGVWFPRRLNFQWSLGNHWPRLQSQFRGEFDDVASVCFSPDGTRIASGSWEPPTLRIWNSQTGQLTLELKGHSHAILSAHFSPDGSQIVSGSQDCTIRIWDARTGAIIFGPLEGHSAPVNSVNFSRNGGHIVSGSDQSVRVWDTRSGALVIEWEAHTDKVASVQFSPDGRRIVSASCDNTVRIWNAQTSELVVGPLDHGYEVLDIDFSPDGTRIASASEDGMVRIWDAQTGVLILGPLQGHTSAVNSVNFSPNSAWIASGSNDWTVRIWDAETGALVGEPLEGHSFSVTSVHFSSDGRRIASGSRDGTVRVWDAQSGTVESGEQGGNAIQCFNLSPDGSRVARVTFVNHLLVQDLQTGVLLAGAFLVPTSYICHVQFSLNGRWIASCSADGSVCVWDAATAALVAGPMEHEEVIVSSLGFLLDGRHITTLAYGDIVRIWDTQTGLLVSGPTKLEGNIDGAQSSSLSQNGTHIATTFEDSTVRVWDSRTGEVVLVLEQLERTCDALYSVNFSPDGTRLACGSKGGAVSIWDAHTGILIHGPHQGHTDEIDYINFSPDGTRIVSGSWQKVCIWDSQTGDLVAGPLQATRALCSPNGTHMVSEFFGVIRVWNIEPDVPAPGLLREMTGADSSRKVMQGSTNPPINIPEADLLPVNPLGNYPTFDPTVEWVLSAGARMFWVPPWLRDGLYLPRNTLLIGSRGTTKLDVTRFVHGREWANCIDPAKK